jgi:hypothetical protein
VEAALLNVSTIVIEFDDGGRWPSWNEYNIFHEIPLSDLDRVLTDIKNDTYRFRLTKKTRGNFIERFRYTYDNNASERIAQAISRVISG